MRLVALCSLLFAGLALAAPHRSTHVVHEKRAAAPEFHGWFQDRRLESNRTLPMRFGLAQQNMQRLEKMLMEVSHPESPQYGQHYTAAEVVDLFSPSKETIEAVTHWLTESGISRNRLRLSANKGWIHLNATAAEVEELLKAEYHVYTHPSGDEQIGKYYRFALCRSAFSASFKVVTVILFQLI